MYDLAVIGGGPGGYVAAERAKTYKELEQDYAPYTGFRAFLECTETGVWSRTMLHTPVSVHSRNATFMDATQGR